MLLSKEETRFVSLLKNVECFSLEQAITILKKNCGCTTDSQANKILHELIARDYLRMSPDNAFVVAGGRKSNYQSKLNRAIIEDMYIVMDQLVKEEDIQFIRTDASGADLKFVTNNRLCHILNVNEENFYKIIAMQQMYLEKKKQLEKCNVAEELFFFVFSACQNEEEFLEKIASLNLEISHFLVFLKDDDITTKPRYNVYKC